MRWVSYHLNGGFLKWVYPQIIHFNRIVPYKPTILGTPNLGTPQIYNLTSLENSLCLAPDVFLPQALEVLLRNVNSLELKKLVPDIRPRHRGSWCLGCWHGGWCPCFHGSLLFGGRLSRLADEIGKAHRPVFTLLFFFDWDLVIHFRGGSFIHELWMGSETHSMPCSLAFARILRVKETLGDR